MFRDRPIPAFYCCYLLRSTIRHSAVYVGSTPNPARRLRQHNGLAKGGAARTSRESLRPWEMACIVAGFPSQIAALQFEWAWQNPHITLHIPPKSRIQHATQKKRSGQPKRPRHTVSSLLSNLHLLLRVPLFCRWPLELRFYSQDVYASWLKVTKSATEPIRESISIIQNFSQTREPFVRGNEDADLTKSDNECSGIYMINIGYTSQTAYLEKSKSVFDFEQEDCCAICNEPLEHDMGIHTLCPSPDCAAVTHIRCLSARFTKNIDESLVPVVGICPSCNTELRWVDVMKELSLRMRGKKEVDDLLTRRRAPRAVSLFEARAGLDTDEDLMGKEEHVQIQEDRVGIEESKHENFDARFDELWHIIDDSQESDTEFPP